MTEAGRPTSQAEAQARIEQEAARQKAGYMVRVLTGQFDSGVAFDPIKGVDRLRSNDASEALVIINRKWGDVRELDWKADTRSHSEQVTAWADGRAKALVATLHQDQVGQELIDGLVTLGLADPKAVTQDSAKAFFAGKFYTDFSSNQPGKNLDNLANTFFEAAKVDGKINQAQAQKMFDQLTALSSVLIPILKEEQYIKLKDVTEARLNNALGAYSVKNGQVKATDWMRDQLTYFQDQTVKKAGNADESDENPPATDPAAPTEGPKPTPGALKAGAAAQAPEAPKSVDAAIAASAAAKSAKDTTVPAQVDARARVGSFADSFRYDDHHASERRPVLQRVQGTFRRVGQIVRHSDNH